MQSKCDLIFDRVSAQDELDQSMRLHVESCSECQQIVAAIALVQKHGSPARELQPTEEFLNKCASSTTTGSNASIVPIKTANRIILISIITAVAITAAFLSITFFSDQIAPGTGNKVKKQTVIEKEKTPASHSIEEKDNLINIENSKNRLIFDSPADEVE